MESIDKMRSRHRQTEQEKTIRHPLKDEAMELGEHEKTLAEIFADPHEHDIFVNEYLPTIETTKIKAKDIAESLLNGVALTPAQDTFLEKARMSYNFLRASSERMKESITDPVMLERIADADPRVREIIGKIGAENAGTLLSSKLDTLAASEPKVFKKMIENARSAQKLRESDRAAGIEKDLLDTLARFKIPEEKYFDAVEPSMGAASGRIDIATRTELERLAHEQLGLFGKSMDFITNGSVSYWRGKEMEGVFDRQRALLKEYDKHIAVIGKTLRGTINPDMNLAMQKFMLEGGNLAVKDTRNVITLKDYKTIAEEHTPDARKKRLKAYAVAEAKRMSKKFADLSPTERGDIKDRFVNQEEALQKSKKGSGLIGALLTLLFPSKATLKSEADTIWP